MLHLALASSSVAPLVWLLIVSGVVGAAVWHAASDADRPVVGRRRSKPPPPGSDPEG